MDAGASLLGMVHLFENKGPGALAYHQSISVAIKRPRAFVGFLVAETGCKQGIEHSGLRGRQFISAAGHHHGLTSEFDCLVSITDTLTA